MIDKRFFESFLRVNNVNANASTAEITTVLAQAHWPKAEIEEALMVHSSDGTATQVLAQKRPQMFRPDMDWSSSKLSSLLGIDVVIDPHTFRQTVAKKEQFVTLGKRIFISLCTAIVAITIAATIGLGLMYFFQIGPFHSQVSTII